MSLSAEHRERILEEEKQRLAEEQYREQVRRELASQRSAAPSTAPASPTPPIAAKSHLMRNALTFIGLMIGLWALCLVIFNGMEYLNRHRTDAERAPEPFHRRQSLINKTFTVPAGNAMWFSFDVAQGAGVTLTGTLEFYGGRRDVAVSLTDTNDMPVTNFGRMIGTGRISQHLPPGQYKLMFDNRFSLVTPKIVTPNVVLEN